MKSLQRLSLTDLTNLAAEAPDTPMHQAALGVLDERRISTRKGACESRSCAGTWTEG